MDFMQIMAIESFDRGSHRQFREILTRHSQHHWRWAANASTPWKWAMRAGGLSASMDESPNAEILFCTSLIDVAVTRIRFESKIGKRIPTVLYMHENQAEYPGDPERNPDPRDIQFALTNLNSIFAADLVLWNSRWNLESFIGRIVDVLQHCRGLAFEDLEGEIRQRSNVAWCPVEVPDPTLPCPIQQDNVPLVVWPHRHEHDKGPDQLLELARSHRELKCRWALLGERFDRVPESIQIFREEFAESIVYDGYPNRDIYESILGAADWVCSTARHEFFGLSVVEAMFAGCLPWVPAGLSYRELLPAAARGLSPDSPPEDPQAVINAIRWHLGAAEAPNAARRIDSLLEGLLNQPPPLPSPIMRVMSNSP